MSTSEWVYLGFIRCSPLCSQGSKDVPCLCLYVPQSQEKVPGVSVDAPFNLIQLPFLMSVSFLKLERLPVPLFVCLFLL